MADQKLNLGILSLVALISVGCGKGFEPPNVIKPISGNEQFEALRADYDERRASRDGESLLDRLAEEDNNVDPELLREVFKAVELKDEGDRLVVQNLLLIDDNRIYDLETPVVKPKKDDYSVGADLQDITGYNLTNGANYDPAENMLVVEIECREECDKVNVTLTVGPGADELLDANLRSSYFFAKNDGTGIYKLVSASTMDPQLPRLLTRDEALVAVRDLIEARREGEGENDKETESEDKGVGAAAVAEAVNPPASAETTSEPADEASTEGAQSRETKSAPMMSTDPQISELRNRSVSDMIGLDTQSAEETQRLVRQKAFEKESKELFERMSKEGLSSQERAKMFADHLTQSQAKKSKTNPAGAVRVNEDKEVSEVQIPPVTEQDASMTAAPEPGFLDDPLGTLGRWYNRANDAVERGLTRAASGDF